MTLKKRLLALCMAVVVSNFSLFSFNDVYQRFTLH